MSKTYSKRKKYFIITTVIVLIILMVAKLYTSNNSGNNFQEVIQSVPNEKLLGLTNFISNENEKTQDAFFKKLSKITIDMIQKQDERLKKLEQQNELLLQELHSLKLPPQSASLREKLVFLYPYDLTTRFPGYVWQSWKYGLNDDRFDSRFREGEIQWANKNPGFVHEIFNDDTAHAVIRHLYKQIPEVGEAYKLLPEVILKMDFFRYLILFAKGGVYADIDTYPLQPIPNWIPQNVSPEELGLIISIGSDSNSPNWRLESARRLQFGQFVIQAKPGHPILREMIAQIVEETVSKSKDSNPDAIHLTGSSNQKNLKILKWTGSGRWTDIIMNYFNDYIQSSIYQKVTWKDFHELKVPKLVSDVLVLPLESFSSEIDIPKDGKIGDPLAFVKHYAANIWKSS
ncbi:uncharacterized protein PRCAT00001878001 [Priceomyces carsonii]|uniref:uncharacterized protein n=1 Tax=Priceomyces carsonii TaxID=28549 RepID=UPI002ED84950|nr:unnamed protein product [Priceomyces carsonii]